MFKSSPITSRVLSLPTIKVKSFTFGCKVNFADTAHLEAKMIQKEGAKLAKSDETPDLILVNTCTVTASADRQAKQLIRKLHRNYPHARFVVTGCSAEAKPDEYKKLDGVERILPIQKQSATAPMIDRPEGRTRALLKMQDGCNAYCAFCILPYIRGRSRSIPFSHLLAQAQHFLKSGVQEMVVTGTHLASYGRDLEPRTTFSKTLEAILNTAPGLKVRISSLEPAGVTSDLISVIRERGEIRPHFHIPIQSGSDSILRKMNRKYTVNSVTQKLEALAKVRTDVGIGTDIIVGFPGETEEDFEKTFDLISKSPITFLHVFRYSPREGTKAYSMTDTVSDRVKFDRMRKLIDLGERKKRTFYERFLGKARTMLVEKKRDSKGRLNGYTPEYVPVRVLGPDRLMEREIEVRVNRIEEDYCLGEAA